MGFSVMDWKFYFNTWRCSYYVKEASLILDILLIILIALSCLIYVFLPLISDSLSIKDVDWDK